MQLAGAYAVIANGGYRVAPLVIKRITDAEGKVVFEAPAAVLDESQHTVSTRSTFMISSLLQEVTRSGTAARAQGQLKRPDLYGKTGTTNDVVDAWFAGFQPNLVAVVWVGYDKPQSLGGHSSGASLALPTWIQFMATALSREPVRELSAPEEGVVRGERDWRYAEWANGGFITSLGLDDQAIDRSLIPMPLDAASAASASEPAASASDVSAFPDIHP
jgi:penicillin-binding protein 1A